MPRWVKFFLLAIFSIFFGHYQPALAQSPTSNGWVDYAFGEQITFHAKIQSEASIQSADILFQALNDPHTSVFQATVTPAGDGSYVLTYTHLLSDYSLRAFSRIDYWFKITPAQGKSYKSPTYNFVYDDNRFAWRTLEAEPFTVHWYQGDNSFGQAILDAAKSGREKAKNLITLRDLTKLDIYIYADGQAMDATLHPSTGNWVAGHADPDLGVIVAALPDGPEQRMLMEQRIPHELMHILLYQITGFGYRNLPTWLSEGLASMVELYSNPDYRVLLDNAVQNKALLPIDSLCSTFPRDASNALLSYAEAASFTKYLRDTYGIAGLNNLVNAYANGIDCQHGAKTVLGVDLSHLEQNWRQDALAEHPTASALENLLPWLILLIASLAVPVLLMVRKIRPHTADPQIR